MTASSDFLLNLTELVIVTLGSGSSAIKLFFSTDHYQMPLFNFQALFFGTSWISDSTVFMLCDTAAADLEVVAWGWGGGYSGRLNESCTGGFSAENWSRTQEVLKEHEQYHFVKENTWPNSGRLHHLLSLRKSESFIVSHDQVVKNIS